MIGLGQYVQWALQAIYLMLPAYFANMAPVIVRSFTTFLDTPIDGGKSFRGERIFGANKTWRGIFFGVLFGIVVAYIQFLLSSVSFFSSLGVLPYDLWIVIGFLLGLGALFGDLCKSFVKRRLHFPPGKPFIPFDQIDFVIGSMILVSLVIIPPIHLIIIALLISILLHITVNHLAYYLKIRKEKW